MTRCTAGWRPRPAHARSRPGRTPRWPCGPALQLLDRVLYGVRDLLQLFIGVHRRDGGADQVLADGHGRGDGHDGEDALVEERLPEGVDALLGAEDDRHGGRLAAP